jgi:hypothetical protein
MHTPTTDPKVAFKLVDLCARLGSHASSKHLKQHIIRLMWVASALPASHMPGIAEQHVLACTKCTAEVFITTEPTVVRVAVPCGAVQVVPLECV